MSQVHCGSAVRFCQALPGLLITAHHFCAFPLGGLAVCRLNTQKKKNRESPAMLLRIRNVAVNKQKKTAWSPWQQQPKLYTCEKCNGAGGQPRPLAKRRLPEAGLQTLVRQYVPFRGLAAHNIPWDTPMKKKENKWTLDSFFKWSRLRFMCICFLLHTIRPTCGTRRDPSCMSWTVVGWFVYLPRGPLRTSA